MLMSIAYAMNGDTYMADKFKAISSLAQLRSLGRVRKSGQTYENNQPKTSELIQSQKNVRASQTLSKEDLLKSKQSVGNKSDWNFSESEAGFGGIRLSSQE